MNKEIKYLPVLNILRGIAALLVVLFHFVTTTTGYVEDEIIRNIFSYGDLGVTIFFVISGIVIPFSMIKKDYKISNLFSFLKKRMIRVEIPFLASMILGILYLIARDYVPSSYGPSLVPSVETIIYNIFYLVPFNEGVKWINPVYWTLAIEFQYYIFLSLFMPLLMQKKILFRFFFYIMICVAILLVPEQLFLWFPIFMIGISYVLNIYNYINKIEYFLLLLVSCSMILIYHGTGIALTSIITILIVHFFTNYTSKIGNFFGNISYSLYLLHTITGTVFINFMSHHFTEPYQKFIVILGGIILSLFSAYLFYKYVEKPSKVLSSKIKYNKQKGKLSV